MAWGSVLQVRGFAVPPTTSPVLLPPPSNIMILFAPEPVSADVALACVEAVLESMSNVSGVPFPSLSLSRRRGVEAKYLLGSPPQEVETRLAKP